jgi:hypothetical protein
MREFFGFERTLLFWFLILSQARHPGHGRDRDDGMAADTDTIYHIAEREAIRRPLRR